MKKIKSLLLVASVLLTSAVLAQTVDEIIDKHINAIGGKEKLSQVKSLSVELSLEVMGSQGPAIEYTLAGKGFKRESEFNGSKIINCYTDKGGWAVNPFAGGTDAQPMPDAMYKSGKDQIYVTGSLGDYAAKGNKVELTGKENSNYKIKVTGENTESLFLIDTATYFITKTTQKGEMMGQTIEIITTFSDYKKTDFGIVLAYARATDFGSFSISAKVTKVEVNKELDPKIFEMPK
jgi:hypothetical protein